MERKHKLALFFVILVVLIWNIYYSSKSETNFTKTTEENNIPDNFPNAQGLRWTHMPITYYIENERECGTHEVNNRLRRAFETIEEATNQIVYFKKVDNSSSADIDINCSFIKDCYEERLDIRSGWKYYYEKICEHDLGRAEITEYSGNKILKAKIEMIGYYGFSETGFIKGVGRSGFGIGTCGHVYTEIHEILHAFGYQHNEYNSKSIMSPYLDYYTTKGDYGCLESERYIDTEIVEDLIETYS